VTLSASDARSTGSASPEAPDARRTPEGLAEPPVTHPADRLLAAFASVGAPVSVGLDPVMERMPADLASLAPAVAIERFSLGVLEAVRESAACVKLQSACYERLGPDGVRALHTVSHAAAAMGFEVILDAKRGDIGISAEHYAAASLLHRARWTTINGYLGADGILPFLRGDAAQPAQTGAFVLVRTSNPSGDLLQSLRLEDGRTVAEAMADLVRRIGLDHRGASGLSALGAVVGATKRQDAAALRARMPEQFFLVPGFGAQGGGVDDVLPCFRTDGTGAIITASRSVIYPESQPGQSGLSWQGAIAQAARAFRNAIRTGLGASGG
jgi:orotidine-5'-phosphate decarboxylase